MLERAKFIAAVEEGAFTMTELCARFSISRKTAYKWLGRYRDGGLKALDERSRAPKHIPHRTAKPVEEALLALRRRRPDWGARKLLTELPADLLDRYARPSASTTTDLLRRNGLLAPPRKRRQAQHATARPLVAEAPNDLWCADFKGEFLLGNRVYCYPLTVSDAYSRFLIGCQALCSTRQEMALPVFERLFREYGLPERIRTDNGAPFASTALCGLSALGVYFIKLGIKQERIRPGKPQDNGRHERMHRTLKAATTRPPASSMPAQQERFDRFRLDYNTERPHEALSMQTPSACYQASVRPMPEVVPQPSYAGHVAVRRVGKDGGVSWRGAHVFLSSVLVREYVGFEEVDEGLWSVLFYDVVLARYDERAKRLYT